MPPEIIGPLMWSIVAGLSAVVAWIGKDIVKPWSDAYLVLKNAEAEHIKNVDKALVMMVEETHAQSTSLERHSDLLKSIDIKTEQQCGTLNSMNADSKTLCRAEHAVSSGLSAERVDHLLVQIVGLQKDAIQARVDLLELAKAESNKIKETAIAVAEILKKGAGQQAIDECEQSHAGCPLKQNGELKNG